MEIVHFVLTLLLAAVTPSSPVNGRLCIASSAETLTNENCIAVSGLDLEVAASKVPRVFAWTRDDGTEIALGTIAVDAAKVDLAKLAAIQLTISADSKRFWPGETNIRFSKHELLWQWALSPKVVGKLRRVLVPEGSYYLQVSALHYETLSLSGVRPKVARPLVLGEKKLVSKPLLTGRVASQDGQALSSAAILSPSGDAISFTNEQGAFEAELETRALPFIRVAYPGLATQRIELKNLQETTDLGKIVLTKSSTLSFQIDRTNIGEIDLSLELLQKVERQYAYSSIEKRALSSEGSLAEFRDLSPGKYLLAIAGPDPLNRMSVWSEIKETASVIEQEIKIEPLLLEGSVLFGKKPLPDAGVELVGPEHAWREQLVTDAEGKFGGDLWDRGSLFAAVQGETMSTSFVAR